MSAVIAILVLVGIAGIGAVVSRAPDRPRAARAGALRAELVIDAPRLSTARVRQLAMGTAANYGFRDRGAFDGVTFLRGRTGLEAECRVDSVGTGARLVLRPSGVRRSGSRTV